MAQNITKLTITKRFTYRGDTQEEWSNGYVFKSLPPVTTAEWDALRGQIVGLELPILNDQTFVVRVVGHSSTDPGALAAYEFDYTVPGPPPQGTFNGTTLQRMAGDQAAVVEWLTNLKTKLGKPIYLRKYLHGGFVQPAAVDDLGASYVTALTTFASAFTSSSPWGGLTNDAAAAIVTGHKVIPWATTQEKKSRVESWACIKLDNPGAGLVVFADADISAAGTWACSRSELVVETARAVHVIEEELFSLKRAFPLP